MWCFLSLREGPYDRSPSSIRLDGKKEKENQSNGMERRLVHPYVGNMETRHWGYICTTYPEHRMFHRTLDGNVTRNQAPTTQHRSKNETHTRTKWCSRSDPCSCSWKTKTWNTHVVRRNPTRRRKQQEQEAALP